MSSFVSCKSSCNLWILVMVQILGHTSRGQNLIPPKNAITISLVLKQFIQHSSGYGNPTDED
jgi:hypothetical protein